MYRYDRPYVVQYYSLGCYQVVIDSLPETEATRARNDVFPVPEGPYAKKLCLWLLQI